MHRGHQTRAKARRTATGHEGRHRRDRPGRQEARTALVLTPGPKRGTTMEAPLIELDRVEKDYATGAVVVRALVDVSLSIARGEFVSIVGTSGSGKSTMMNILGCLDRPTRGRYWLDGVDVGDRSSDARAIVRNRMIGFVFQGYNLLARNTALENV